MKKFWLSLGLTLMLTCWCGAGNYGLGTGAAFGQDYYNRSLSCNPSDPACYGDYFPRPMRTHFPNFSTMSLHR